MSDPPAKSAAEKWIMLQEQFERHHLLWNLISNWPQPLRLVKDETFKPVGCKHLNTKPIYWVHYHSKEQLLTSLQDTLVGVSCHTFGAQQCLNSSILHHSPLTIPQTVPEVMEIGKVSPGIGRVENGKLLLTFGLNVNPVQGDKWFLCIYLFLANVGR